MALFSFDKVAVLKQQRGTVLVILLCFMIYVMISVEYLWNEYTMLEKWMHLTSDDASIKIPD